jgi:Leucine-rich repeat (LRR) protein
MDNELSNFSGLIQLKELKTLCLTNNNIESVFPLTKTQRAQMNRSQYSQYQKRDVNEKRLSVKTGQSDDEGLFPKLEVLHLGNNKIKDISLLHLRRMPSLKSVFLEGNDISKIDGLDGCSSMRHLVLDR